MDPYTKYLALRDQMAIEAMKSLIAKAPPDGDIPADYIAQLSYHLADEMLKAR